MTINKEMTVAEVLSLDRTLAGIFLQHGLMCLGCPSASMESLEQASMVHGINLDFLLKDLNEAYEADQQSQ